MKIELKRCPFCGGKAHILDMGFPHWIYCEECGARVQGGKFGKAEGVKASAEAWNRRQEPTLYGYDISHLAMVAGMLSENAVTPDSMRETLTNVQKMFEIIYEALQKNTEEALRIAMGGWTDEAD